MPLKRKYPTAKRSRSRPPPMKRYRPQNIVALYNRRPELKRVDQTWPGGAANNFSTTVHFNLLNLVRLGNDDYQRIGREIKMHSLDILGQIYRNPTANQTSDFLRYMVVYDRQPNQAIPAISQIITSVSPAGAATNLVTDQINEDYKERFKILLDRCINVPGDQAGNSTLASQILAQPAPFTIKHHIPLYKLATRYLNDDNAITSITVGSLFLVLYGQNPTANANYFFNGTTRVTYYDY